MMDDYQEWIGRSSTATAYLDAAQANRMAATLDRAPTFQPGDALPPAWHWLFFHELVPASDLGPDGHPRKGVTLPPVPLPRRMWAGGTLRWHAPLRLGAWAERTTTIRSIDEKHGRSGALVFLTVEHAIRSAGALCLSEEQTIVYREHAAAPPPAPPAAPIDAAYSQQHTLDQVALFRYSALSFNGHRIHYDVDYCRNVEGYPDLVIHGPLLATLLLDLCVAHAGLPSYFRYRATSPLFLPHPFAVCGTPVDGGARLWASNHAGGMAMEAEARW